jgi:transcriptional regulator with XRE-family HTH domain
MIFYVGEKIKTERKRRKLTQKNIADALGMSHATISQIEAGIVQDIGIRKLVRILDFLGLEIAIRSAGTPPTLDELREER